MNIINRLRLSKGKLYIAISLALWGIVEYITVWHSKFNEWLSLMPWALLQYIFIVLIFNFLIFYKKWSEKRIFFIMIFIMYTFEFLWRNFLLFSLFWFVPGSLLLISIWGFLTFIPLWVVNKSLHVHKWQVIYYLLWILVVITMGLLAYF